MQQVRDFIKRIPNLTGLSKQPSGLLSYLGFFLEESSPEQVITPARMRSAYADARLKSPVNVSQSLISSREFVRAKGGYRLSHEATEKVSATLLPLDGQSGLSHASRAVSSAQAPSTHSEGRLQSSVQVDGDQIVNAKDVFVVYGRDTRLRQDLFAFLRALGLNPLEFESLVQRTGSTNPYTLEAIQKGFRDCRVCVVLFSPDEKVSLRSALRGEEGDKEEFQSRPNVLLEAGMALALHPDRTVFVQVGKVRRVSDVDGKQYVALDNTAAARHKFVGRLRIAGCDLSNEGEDWLSVGNFVPTPD